MEKRVRSGAWRRLGVLAALGSLALVLVTPGQIALAEAGSGRSCQGHEASEISPPGSNSEFPGGMPEFMTFIRSFGGSPGLNVASFAKLHLGSHALCDAPFE